MSHKHCSNLSSLKKHVNHKLKHSTQRIDHNINNLEEDVELCCDTLQGNITEGFNAVQTNIQNINATLEARIDGLVTLLGALQDTVDSILECTCVT